MKDTHQPARVGVLLANSQLRLLYCNDEAAKILAYPNEPDRALSLGVLPEGLLHQVNGTRQVTPGSLELTSGRRRYLCRAYRLDRGQGKGSSNASHIVVILERPQSETLNLSRVSAHFQLTNREREAVGLLLKGLSSKEIANAMRISPNTVKSFLKLVMAKVGASSRTGIVARIFERLGPHGI